MTEIEITLSLPPKALSPNSRPHWAAKARATKAHRGEAFLMTRREVARLNTSDKWWSDLDDDILVRSTFYHRVSRRRDRDNATASLKAAMDGIAEAMGVDDSRFVIAPVCFEKSAGEDRVAIVLRPLRQAERPSQSR